MTKKTIVITCIIIIIFLGIGVLIYIEHYNAQPQTLREDNITETPVPSPLTSESTSYDHASTAGDIESEEDKAVEETPTVTETVSPVEVKIQIDGTENTEQLDNIDIEGMSEEELRELLEQDDLTDDQILAVKEKLYELDKSLFAEPDTSANNTRVSAAQAEPQLTPEPDEDGYIYTKEEAIEIFRTEYQKIIDNNGFDYSYAREHAISEGISTEEEFEADLQQLLNDPYSSDWLTPCFEQFRKLGDMGVLIVDATIWLSSGGDDGNRIPGETR